MCFGTCFSFQYHAALQVALYLDLVGCRNSECSDTPTSISIHKRPITSPIPVNNLDTASFADRNRKTGLGFHQKRRIRRNPSFLPSLPLPSPPSIFPSPPSLFPSLFILISLRKQEVPYLTRCHLEYIIEIFSRASTPIEKQHLQAGRSTVTQLTPFTNYTYRVSTKNTVTGKVSSTGRFEARTNPTGE